MSTGEDDAAETQEALRKLQAEKEKFWQAEKEKFWQAEREKLQAEKEKMQADLQAEKEKMQADLQAEKEKMQADLQAEKEKVQADKEKVQADKEKVQADQEKVQADQADKEKWLKEEKMWQAKREKVQAEWELRRAQIPILNLCLQEEKFTADDLGDARNRFKKVPPSANDVLTMITELKEETGIVEELRKAEEGLWKAREELKYIRIKQGKQAISVKDVLAEPLLAQRLQHPFELAKTSGMTWTYQNRDDLQNGLCEVFEKNYTAFAAKERDKQALLQPIICAGLGMGKSRALMMVPEMLANKTKGNMVFTFNVPFENGPTYNSEYESMHMSAVLDRICYHLLGFTTDTSRTFRQWNDTHRADFTLDELVEGLCKHFGKEEQYPDNVVCLLMVDGVHNLVHDELCPGGNKEIRVFLRDVMLACQMASPYFVFSVCTMTARKTAVDALKGSSVVPCYLQLPPVTTRPETLPKAVSDDLFEIVKGFGRAVEVLCDVAKDHPERVRDDPGLLIAVCDQIRVRYTGIVVSVEEQTMLLRYALLKKPVNEDADLAAHLSMGLMSLQREGGKTYLRLSLIWAIVNSIGRPGSLLAKYNFWETHSPSSFETFVQWFRCVLSKLHDTGSMNVVDLHKGVQWLNEPSDRMFTNTPLTLRFAAGRTETRGTKQEQKIKSKASPRSHIKEETPLQGAAFLNALGAPHGDIFVELDDKSDIFLWHTIATFPEQWVEWCKQDEVLKDRIIGVVDATSFEEYFNFFAPLWLHSKQKEEPNSSVSSRRKRKRKRQSSQE